MNRSLEKIDHAELGLNNVLSLAIIYRIKISLFVITMMIVTVVILALVPKKYYSSTTLIPTNPQLSDKSRLFNSNIDQLYSIYGSGDDLDRLYAMAKTEAMYMFIADSFKLVKNNADVTEKSKTAAKIRRSIELKKSADGELIIGVWTKDRMLSANIANAVAERLKQINRQAIVDFNQPVIDQLKAKYNKLMNDSMPSPDNTQKMNEASAYRQRIDEMELSVQTAPSPLIISDKAVPAIKPGKPKWLLTLAAVFLASLLFATLVVTLLHQKKAADSGRQPDLI